MQVNNKMIVDKTKAIINNYCKLSNFTFKKEDNIFTICEANRGFMVLSIDFDNEEYHYTVTYFLYENMSKSDEIKYWSILDSQLLCMYLYKNQRELIFLEDSNALVVSMGFKFHEISQINEVLLSELLKISNFAKNTTALLNEIYLLNQQIELN